MEFKFRILNADKFRECVGFDTDKDFVKSLKLKDDQHISAEIWRERNILLHRKFFAFLNAVIYLLPEEKKYDSLRNIIGEVDEIIGMDGQVHLQAKSISFKSMDEEKFSPIYKSCVDATLKHFLHWISIKDFENTIANFL